MSANVVVLHSARLVLVWATAGLSCVRSIVVFNQLPGLTQPGHPSGAGKISTNKSCGVNLHTTHALAVYLWYHSVSWYLARERTTLRFKGELNLDNKWQSDDLFYIIMNETHHRFNQF